jgi:hypothetical protein
VFTSFTLSQTGMARHHIRLKEPGWRRGLFINGMGALLSLVVDVIIAVTKFSRGAWVVIVLVPILVLALLRLNRAYAAEAEELLTDAPRAAEAPILRRHVVLVFLDSLDLAGARALQYARALMPDEMRAVHFAIDMARANALRLEWLELGLTRIPLEIVECADRRITRAAVETVAEALADGKTEVSVLLPRIEYDRVWHRMLHDRTAHAIAQHLVDLPHANVTFVPYHLGPKRRVNFHDLSRELANPDDNTDAGAARAGTVTPIGVAQHRHQVTISGRVHAIRVQPRAEVATLECALRDNTGTINLVFLGRKHVAGIEPGTQLTVTGVVGMRQGRLEIINPDYQFRLP